MHSIREERNREIESNKSTNSYNDKSNINNNYNNYNNNSSANNNNINSTGETDTVTANNNNNNRILVNEDGMKREVVIMKNGRPQFVRLSRPVEPKVIINVESPTEKRKSRKAIVQETNVDVL